MNAESKSLGEVALSMVTAVPVCVSTAMQRFAGERRSATRSLLGILPGVLQAAYGSLALPLAAGMAVLHIYANWLKRTILAPSPLTRARLPRALDPLTGLAPVSTFSSLAFALLRQQTSNSALRLHEAVLVAFPVTPPSSPLNPALARAINPLFTSDSSVVKTVQLATLTNMRFCIILAPDPLACLSPLETASSTLELASVICVIELHDLICVSLDAHWITLCAWGQHQPIDTYFVRSSSNTNSPDTHIDDVISETASCDGNVSDRDASMRVTATARSSVNEAAATTPRWAEQGLSRVIDQQQQARVPDADSSNWAMRGQNRLILPSILPLRCITIDCQDVSHAHTLAAALRGNLELVKQMRQLPVQRARTEGNGK